MDSMTYFFMEHIGLDPSRIAAGVVTAVGFLGAGVIFTRHMNVMGITTAAGIWATVGIGMAFGAGMYILSAASTLLILLFRNFCSIPGCSTPEVHPSSRSPCW
ncbi:MAG: MgtC/SapB family protein [[Clostridium] scindens]